MSLITDDPEQQSPRDCSRSRSSSSAGGKHCHRRRAAIAVSSTTVALALILWLTLRPPSSPRFSLLAATATVAGNNTSAAIIVTAHNPNARATALYGQLRASGSYAGVPLAAGAPLQALEQPSDDAVFSAALTSAAWSWRPSSAAPGMLVLLLRVRVEGQLRWKVAAWVSGRHGLTVECVAAMVPSSSAGPGQQQGSSSHSQCATHVL
ncbi:unnamed protein product [Urochloa decumbens]|uniref:Late embryogenesis abundant protein LEA-2 subgroup domain-containing protein n=1 Tax=Urochloa decumbens TaxID=240449 RepID=A0ABC9H0T7_9POAL